MPLDGLRGEVRDIVFSRIFCRRAPSSITYCLYVGCNDSYERFSQSQMRIIIIQIRPFRVGEAERRHGAILMREARAHVVFRHHGVRTGIGAARGIWIVSAGFEWGCGIFLRRGCRRTGFAIYPVAANRSLNMSVVLGEIATPRKLKLAMLALMFFAAMC